MAHFAIAEGKQKQTGGNSRSEVTDGKTDRCGSCYMSLCAICFAAPLVAVRLNYKFVTKSCVFTDHFNQSNFHFCDNTNGLIYFKYIILMP